MDEFRPDKPVEEEERTEDDDHAKPTEEEVQTEEGDQAKTNEEVSITIPRRNDQTMNQQEQLPRASSSTQVKASYAAIVSRLATSSSSSSPINEPKKKTPYSTVSGSAASSSSAINEASKKIEPPSSSTVSGLADSACSTINEPSKKTESSSSSRNCESSGTVEIKREHVTQKTMNLGSISCATEQSQTENPQEDSSTIRRGDQTINQPNRGSTSFASDQNNRNRSFGMQQQYSPRFGVDHSYAAGFGPQVTRPFMANQTNIPWPGFVAPNYPPWRNQNTYEQHPMRVPGQAPLSMYQDQLTSATLKDESRAQKENGKDDSEIPAWFYVLFDEPNPQEQSGNPEHRDDVVVGVVQEPQANESSSSSTVSGLAASSYSRNGESTGPDPRSINREHVTQNPMVSGQTMNQQTTWSPPNTIQQRPMANQMNITRPAFVEQNYVNHQLSGMHQLNLNAPTPMMYQQQNQMGCVTSQAPMRPETYQQDPYYLPMANQRMTMISPSVTFYFDLNWFNQQLHEQYGFPIDVIQRQASLNAPWYNVRLQDMLQRVFYQNYINQQQHFGFPIGMTHQAPPPNAPRYDLNHQQMQQRRPQTQQPTQSQEFNNGQSSYQGQDKNQKPR